MTEQAQNTPDTVCCGGCAKNGFVFDSTTNRLTRTPCKLRIKKSREHGNTSEIIGSGPISGRSGCFLFDFRVIAVLWRGNTREQLTSRGTYRKSRIHAHRSLFFFVWIDRRCFNVVRHARRWWGRIDRGEQFFGFLVARLLVCP